jgi:peptidoglycan-N-acetylmuramic acid deacetylase
VYCTKCGTKNEDNNAFCKNCGAKLVKSATNNSGVAQTHNSMNFILITGVAVIAILVIVGLVFWKKGDSSEVASTTEVVQEEAVAVRHELSNDEMQAISIYEDTEIDSDIDKSKSMGTSSENWELGFGQEGAQPTGNASVDELRKYDAYYVGSDAEKVIYLTFDTEYENGNTQLILDALNKHNVSATFFVTGTYLESAPELVKQMVEDGHFVGNHTYHNLHMSSISSKESFEKQMRDVEGKFKEITGTEIAHFYRPPRGAYNTNNLAMAKKMGYHTFFWSLAYVDWYEDKQPTKEEAFKKLVGQIHSGAIVLLHSTSKTNSEILDELLTRWEEMGYTFRTLEDFVV